MMTIEEQFQNPLSITLSAEAVVWISAGLYNLNAVMNNNTLNAMRLEINNAAVRHYGKDTMQSAVEVINELMDGCVFGPAEGI